MSLRLGSKEKRRVFKEHLRINKVDLIVIQETKISSMDNFLIKVIWDMRYIGWMALPSIGLVGGITLVWDDIMIEQIDGTWGVFSLSFKGGGHGAWGDFNEFRGSEERRGRDVSKGMEQFYKFVYRVRSSGTF